MCSRSSEAERQENGNSNSSSTVADNNSENRTAREMREVHSNLGNKELRQPELVLHFLTQKSVLQNSQLGVMPAGGEQSSGEMRLHCKLKPFRK